MRVVVTGATGNVGTSVVRALAADAAVTSIVGLARRRPAVQVDKVEWVAADVSRNDLDGAFAAADAVVHLAWLIQPSHRLDVLEATNVGGSKRVFEAAARCGAAALVYASSVGAYSAGPKDSRVDVPVMDTAKARRELGWHPTRTSGQALLELLEGFADRASAPTAPLARTGWFAPAVTPVTPQVPAS